MADQDIDLIRAQLAASPRPASLAERRARLDALGGQYVMPPGVTTESVRINGREAEWTVSPPADPSRALLFLHGGGYVSGSIASHRHMVAQLGIAARCRTLALDYRLAPEHPFPAALDDALAGYRFLRDHGFAPEHIALCGESAGGGLTVATLVSLREAGEALPACAWLSSPWVDLAQTGGSMQTKAAVDPLIQKPYLDELAAAYLQRGDAADPRASPIHAALHGLPPMLIQVGSAETLLDDSVRLAAAAGAVGVRTTLDVWPDMIHAFTLFYQQVAAGRRALEQVGRFVREQTGAM